MYPVYPCPFQVMQDAEGRGDRGGMSCTPGCLEMDWPEETSGCSPAHKLLLPGWHLHHALTRQSGVPGEGMWPQRLVLEGQVVYQESLHGCG